MMIHPTLKVAVVVLLTTSLSHTSSASEISSRREDAAAAVASSTSATSTTRSRELFYDNKALLKERTHTEKAKYLLDYCLTKLMSIKNVNERSLAYHVSHKSCGGDGLIDRRNTTTVTMMERSEVIGTVTFSCNDVLVQRECHILPHCQSNTDCELGRTWCRPTKNRLVASQKNECVPYREIGETCYGFGIENFNGVYCRPGLNCDGQDWNTLDASGICLRLNSPCKNDEDCTSGGDDDGFHHIGSRWCRPTDATGSSSECVSYQFEGEQCTGLVPTFAQQRCAPNMECKNTNSASNAADAGGTCESIANLDDEQGQQKEDNDETLSSCPDIGGDSSSNNCITTQSREDCIMLQSMGCQEIIAIESSCPIQYECVDDSFDTNSSIISPEYTKLPLFSIAAIIIGAISLSTAIMLLLHFSDTADKTDDENSAAKKSSTDLSESNESSSGEDEDEVKDDDEEETFSV